jgi:hypothetical protein
VIIIYSAAKIAIKTRFPSTDDKKSSITSSFEVKSISSFILIPKIPTIIMTIANVSMRSVIT